MEKLRWKKSEVVSFLEQLILENNADEKEIEMYESYKWNDDKLDKSNYMNTYKKLIKKMKKYYEGE